jgi:transcriptional regulator with GAF, ATPase, and Fis domain
MCELPPQISTFGAFKESNHSRITLVKTLFGVLSLLILFHPPLLAQPEAKPKNVLVLATYRPSAPVAHLWERGIRSVLEADPANRIKIDFEYLELIRIRDDRYVKLLLDLYRHKYTKLKPDLIIPIYNGALEFVLKYGAELFPGIPVVFGGVEKSFLGNRALGLNITGIFSVNSYRETLDLALALHPGTRHVAIVAGAGMVGRAWGSAARVSYRSYENRIDLIDLMGLPMPVILKKVANLPPQTVLIYITLLKDGDGNKFTAPESVSQISHAANAPTYSFWDLMLGHGIVGGNLSNIPSKGQAVAELGLSILNGNRPADLPPVKESNLQYKVDWRQLKRWSISEDELPSGSIVNFKEFTVWDRYKVRIIGVFVLIMFQTLIISYLLYQRRKRRRAEQEVETRLEFEELVSGISARFVDLDAVNIGSQIGASLKQISNLLGFDRSSIFEFSIDRKQMSVLSYHAKEDIQPPPITVAMDQFPRITAKTFEGELVIFSGPTELKDYADSERLYFEQQGIRGGIILPLAVSGSTFGLVAFMVLHAPKPWPPAIVKRLRLVAEIFSNALIRKQAEEKLLNRLEFEKFISALSYDIINLPADKVDSEIINALSRIGRYMGVDRSFLFQFNWNKTKFHIPHLWEADGVQKDQVVRGMIVKDHFPWLADNLPAGNDIVISDVKELPPVEAHCESEYCRNIGIQSFIILPIQVQDAPLCAIGLDAIRTQRYWSHEDKSRLRLIGEIFANAIARKHSDLELQETYTEIKELKEQLEAESTYLQEEIKLEHNFENIIGQSEELKYVLYQVEQVASTDSSVLILGETGTGKELVARAIHKLSSRSNRVLVKVNCAALPTDLIESELFGREKGAFTGATTTQIGRFELANGSTILLDEIGELPLALQAKLLQVYESGEFERLGSPKTLHSNARIIAATNRDIEDEVHQGRFREDLWYRLKVFTVTLPPLRRRKADIPLLIGWFMDQLSRKMGKPAIEIPKHTIEALQDYDWPGNVRELKNMIESALITGQTGKLEFDLPKNSENQGSAFKSLEEMERDYILQVLKTKNWKIQGAHSAASVLKVNPNTLRARLKKLGIKKPTA